MIVAADWELDGTVSPNSIPVIDNVTDDVEQFPCPTGTSVGQSVS